MGSIYSDVFNAHLKQSYDVGLVGCLRFTLCLLDVSTSCRNKQLNTSLAGATDSCFLLCTKFLRRSPALVLT